jgi:hypothetical protein
MVTGQRKETPQTNRRKPDRPSPGYVERQNPSVRMTNRRYTRLTNGFSKCIENHAASVALGYFAYNFIKIHRTLRTSPAMAAGVTDRLWDTPIVRITDAPGLDP